MAIRIFFVYEAVVIDEVVIAGIVRRIDIDDINLALVRVGKGGEGFEIIAFDKDMVWCIAIGTDDGF